MTSVVEICNMALGNIRAGSINDLNESSLQAQQCKLRFNILRDKLLRETNWNWARKIEALALMSDVTIFNYAYAYMYPSDCLKIERLIGPYEETTSTGASYALSRVVETQLKLAQYRKIPYDIFNVDGDKVIGCNESDLRIDYTAKVTDPNKLSEEFVLALSHLLASEIAIPIVGATEGRKLRAESLQIYKEYLASAVAFDSNEKHHEVQESEFVTVRS